MGAAVPKPPLAIPPHSKLWGFLAFSREKKEGSIEGENPAHSYNYECCYGRGEAFLPVSVTERS